MIFVFFGLKIVYFGDCCLFKKFVELGKGVYLLLYECIFEDGFKGDVVVKKYFIISEVFVVGRDMGVRRILFMYFS